MGGVAESANGHRIYHFYCILQHLADGKALPDVFGRNGDPDYREMLVWPAVPTIANQLALKGKKDFIKALSTARRQAGE